MSSIKLTTNHCVLLIQMCKALFPEYPIISMTGYYLMFQTVRERPNKRNKNFSIHWFELCMMVIVPKLLPAFIDMEEFYSGLNGFDEAPSYQKHPVDYLYEQFKSLSNVNSSKTHTESSVG